MLISIFFIALFMAVITVSLKLEAPSCLAKDRLGPYDGPSTQLLCALCYRLQLVLLNEAEDFEYFE
jgi:hypothetical protein